MKLKGKKALITGGGKGIGKAVAKALLKEGASVVICGRTKEILERSCNELSEYGDIDYVECDISNQYDVKKTVGLFKKEMDKIRYLGKQCRHFRAEIENCEISRRRPLNTTHTRRYYTGIHLSGIR